MACGALLLDTGSNHLIGSAKSSNQLIRPGKVAFF
jgi:hypothetical protein